MFVGQSYIFFKQDTPKIGLKGHLIDMLDGHKLQIQRGLMGWEEKGGENYPPFKKLQVFFPPHPNDPKELQENKEKKNHQPNTIEIVPNHGNFTKIYKKRKPMQENEQASDVNR